MSHRLSVLLIVLATLIASTSFRAQAAPLPPNAPQLINELQRATQGAARISYHDTTGMVRFIGTTPDRPISVQNVGAAAVTTPEQAARNFVQQYGALFGVHDQQALQVTRTLSADRGRAVVRFQQRYNNVPILGAELNIQTNARGQTISANGELLPDIVVSTTPAINALAAQQTALTAVARQYGLHENMLHASVPELWIYHPGLLGAPGLQRAALVWRMNVTAGALDPINELVLIDAHRSVVTLHFNQIAAGGERYVCDKNNVRSASDSCTTSSSSLSRSEGEPAKDIADVDLAYEYTGATRDFFAAQFGRDSLDDNGLKLFSTVRFCATTGPCPYDNAYWNGTQMVYGQGFASADDIVAHELTHGLTQYTSGLFYYYQSGAINESLSDVFGELIDQAYGGSSNDDPAVRWQIGEELPVPYTNLRNMADPPNPANPCATPISGSCNPRQPDKMTSALYAGTEFDGGGVHTNSGVNNKAAYLLTDGGTFNGFTIAALGAEKVAQIYYEVAAYLLVSGSDYADLADALQQACTDLVGTNGITAADCTEVANAVAATEMTQTPPAAPATEAPVCVGGLPNDLFVDDLENTTSGNWTTTTISGANGWYYPQNSHNITTPDGQKIDSTYATSGRYNMWGDNADSRTDSAIRMTFDRTLPPNAYFRFNHAYGFDDFVANNNQTFYDGGVIEYSTDRGATWQDAGELITHNDYNGTITTDEDNPLEGRDAFVGQSNGYRSSRLDLSSLAGERVRFRFRLGTDSAYGDYGWYIDDLRLYSCTETGGTRAYMPLAFR